MKEVPAGMERSRARDRLSRSPESVWTIPFLLWAKEGETVRHQLDGIKLQITYGDVI